MRVDRVYTTERFAGVAGAQRGEEGRQRAGGPGVQGPRPVGERIRGLDLGTRLVGGSAQMKRVRTTGIGDVPAAGQAWSWPELRVQPGQAFEELASDGHRG